MEYRASGILVMGCLAIGALGLYLVKYRVQDVQLEVARAEAELAKERESLHLLNAEWAYLNRPERLEKLSQKYLALTPLESTQFISYTQLPEAPPVVDVSAEVSQDSAFFQPVGAR